MNKPNWLPDGASQKNKAPQEDFQFVYNYVKDEKRNRPAMTIRDLRIEAEKVRAENRLKTGNTVHRNLKRALGADGIYGIEAVDRILERLIQNRI